MTGVGVYWFPAFAGMTSEYEENAVPIMTTSRYAKTHQASRLVIIELAGLGPVRRAHRHDEFGGLVRGIERHRGFAGEHGGARARPDRAGVGQVDAQSPAPV